MRRLLLTTASAIALGAGLTLAAPANAWSHHHSMHSNAGHMSQAEIRDVQQKLQADNLYSGRIDGRLGPQTRRAIAEYQKQNGLRVTANLDRQTRDSLLGATGAATPPATAAPMTPAPSKGGGANTRAAPGSGNTATGR